MAAGTIDDPDDPRVIEATALENAKAVNEEYLKLIPSLAQSEDSYQKVISGVVSDFSIVHKYK